ncbi:MAG: NAD(P)-dependent alcohol dehydrogenase [Rhodospirillales bacterium]|nr:NAD(P)-dependent alcohol dehydrogenase [Rhodospirillales bacterium]
MKAWEIVSAGGIDALALNDRPMPEPASGQVVVKVGASSINYRDLSTILDPKARNLAYPTIPNSDGAGVISAVGDSVDGFGEGDRVMGCFFQDWADGPITPAAMISALGGAIDGVLAEYVVLSQHGLVAVPEHLTIEEAATLPCAALTAWNALAGDRRIEAGETVLLLGTGGVSVFAQQFCNLLGAKTIVTSSSDDKLARIRGLGAGETINYVSTPDWQKAVLDLTAGKGVDRVVEVGGPGTLQKSIAATRVGGTIALIGVLTGAGGSIVPTDIMRKSLNVRGIYVGSRRMFKDMAAAIEAKKLRPEIDEVFDFDDAKDAYRKMQDAKHFGKIVIRVSSE